MAEPFPFHLPPDARRLFTSEAVVRRIVNTAKWTTDAELLEVMGSEAGPLLAREAGCKVTQVDSDAAVVKSLEARAKAAGVSDAVTVKQVSYGSLGIADGSLDGVLVLGRLFAPLEETAKRLRALLAPRGRLVLTWPVRVGLKPSKEALEHWEKRLGEPLRLPRECLMAIERQGFEPETAESLTDVELDEYYRDLEAVLGKLGGAEKAAAKSLADEIALHKDGAGRSGVSMALLVVRRKEPGERPPAARDGG